MSTTCKQLMHWVLRFSYFLLFHIEHRDLPCSSACLRVRFLFCTDLTDTTDIFVRTRSVTDSLSICLRLIRVIRTVPSSTSVFSVYFRVRYLFSPFLKSFVVFFSIARAWPMHNMANDHAAGLPTHVFAGEPQKSHEIFAFLIFFSYLCSVFPEVGLTNDILNRRLPYLRILSFLDNLKSYSKNIAKRPHFGVGFSECIG